MTAYEIKELWKARLNDSNFVMKGTKPYKISYGYSGCDKVSNFNYLDMFSEQYNKLQQIDSCDILFTHYPPIIPPTIKEEWADDNCTTFYVFNGITDIKRINPIYWIFGHIHGTYDFTVENTNLISNPLGYPGENSYNQIKTFDYIV
jgi:Icc-related predicted phosphoesterase